MGLMETERWTGWLGRILGGVCSIILCVVCGCASTYFRDAGSPPHVKPPQELSEFSGQEYWTGIVFNGDKIGFTHFRLTQKNNEPSIYEITSEAVLNFRFLLVDKKVNLTSSDTISEDLALREFMYTHDIDGSIMEISGWVDSGTLHMETVSRGETTSQAIDFTGKLYPASIMYLYPVLYGLEIGKTYSYQVFDGETRSITTVSQEVLAFQESDLFEGNGYKLKSFFHSQEVDTWIDFQGRPLLEMALGGVLISGLENEASAQRYLMETTINKDETLLAFSLIRIDPPLASPESLEDLEISISGLDPGTTLPTDDRQQCEVQDGMTLCRIMNDPGQRGDRDYPSQQELGGYMRPSYTICSNHESIVKRAREITLGTQVDTERVSALITWMQANIRKEPIDVFTALDVLMEKRAECQGHAYLYASFARSLGIPTRVISGIVYSIEHQGFLYHAWAESFIEDRWVPVDPTLNQVPADVTHVKVVEGENMADLIPMVSLIGRIRIEVIRAQ
ncbi:MAG: transglutaminase-like domain-containing protein [Desulfomonilia bacterium]